MTKLLKNFKRPSNTVIAVYGVSAFLLLAGFLALYLTAGKNLTVLIEDPVKFKEWLNGYKGFSSAIFVAIRAFQTVIKIIPAEPLEIASGYVFGNFGGLLLCSLGSFIGTLVILALSSVFGKKFVYSFIDEEKLKELPVFNDDKKRRIFLIIFYLIPGTPKDLFGYAVGLTGNHVLEFLIITTICRMPSIITSTIVGSALEEKNYTSAIIVFAATTAVTLISTVLYKYFHDKKLKNAPDDLGEP